MATTNPLADTNTSIQPVSSKAFCIAGINTDVFGFDELSPASKSISCLWLLHPRLQTKEIMASVAASCINDWNQRPSSDRTVGLIAVAFDQRNHGGRKVHDLANQACKCWNGLCGCTFEEGHLYFQSQELRSGHLPCHLTFQSHN